MKISLEKQFCWRNNWNCLHVLLDSKLLVTSGRKQRNSGSVWAIAQTIAIRTYDWREFIFTPSAELLLLYLAPVQRGIRYLGNRMFCTVGLKLSNSSPTTAWRLKLSVRNLIPQTLVLWNTRAMKNRVKYRMSFAIRICKVPGLTQYEYNFSI